MENIWLQIVIQLKTIKLLEHLIILFKQQLDWMFLFWVFFTISLKRQIIPVMKKKWRKNKKEWTCLFFSNFIRCYDRKRIINFALFPKSHVNSKHWFDYCYCSYWYENFVCSVSFSFFVFIHSCFLFVSKFFLDPKTPPEMMQIYDAIRSVYPSVSFKNKNETKTMWILIFSHFPIDAFGFLGWSCSPTSKKRKKERKKKERQKIIQIHICVFFFSLQYFEWLDGCSFALESGKYFEVLGHVEFDLAPNRNPKLKYEKKEKKKKFICLFVFLSIPMIRQNDSCFANFQQTWEKTSKSVSWNSKAQNLKTRKQKHKDTKTQLFQPQAQIQNKSITI